MTQRTTVVRQYAKLPKPRLHALLMEGWARCITRFGKGAFADALEVSGPGLDKQLVGSMPDFATIMDAFDHDDTVLDDIFRERNKRLVSLEAVCDVDDLRLLIARVMLKMQEVTHPDSPGGTAIVHTEYLDGEQLMRELHSASAEWLAKCAEIRRPREVA